ncbi:hypothetical protein HYW82_03180, partial [Candidatus Peregrinibacteria bacterium]|nr:hypothetical protein [Candidatus Peregrinibacteria bacterium]
DIEKIYTDAGDPQGLNLALDSFEELDFLAKEKSLKEHKNLLKENENREEREKNLTIKAAHSKIDAAARKKTISAGGEGTQGKYKEFFNTPENFKNEQTQEPGDLQALKKAYEILISPQPQEQFKNLASYEKRRQDFQKDLKHLADANPNIDPDTIREWQERYDDTGWREREQIATMELPKEIEHQKSKYREAKESGITPDSQETKEGIKSRSELIVALNEYLAEDSEESVNRGLREIRLYFINNPEAENDRTLLYLEEQLAHRKRELGPTKQHAEPDNDRIMEEIDNVAENDTHIDDHLFEEQLRTLNLEGAKKNEQRHNKKTSAHERAMEESLNNAENGSIEKKLTRDAYDQMGDEYIINADKTGEELMEIKFSDEEISTQDRINLDSRTYDEQGKLANEQGFSHISMTDKTGHEISSSEAEKLQDKNLAHIEADMVARAEERTKTKGDTKILDLQSRIAASRHAREIIEQKRHERLVI